MNRNSDRKALLSTAAACLALLSAQSSADDSPTLTAAPGLEEIVVTAQRRSETLERTPVAVVLLSSEELAQKQIVSEFDLRSATPGLSVRAGLSSNQINYSLRGQSQDASSGTRPGVLPYINEVQIGGQGGATAFYDLQSVQVLKGPQGTLFGRSATGGAVLFTTAKPSNELGGYISALAGNYSAKKVEAAINAPLVGDALLSRLTGFYQKRDGFQRNLFDGGREGDLDRYGLRGSLTANVGDNLHNALVVDFLHTHSESTEAVLAGLLPFTGGGDGNPPYIPIEFLYAGTATPTATATGQATTTAFLTPAFLPPGVTPATATPTQLAAAQATASSVAVPFYNAYFSTHPGDGIRGELAAQRARGPFIVNSDASNFYRANNTIVTNVTTMDINDDTQLKNVLGYTHLKSAISFEADALPYGTSQTGLKGSNTGWYDLTRQFSEEPQLLGKTLNGKLSYVTGLYFSDERDRALRESQFFDLLLGGTDQRNDYVITNKTSAAYAQGTYSLNDTGLATTAGVRYTHEKVGKETLPTDSIRAALGDPAPPGFTYDSTTTFNHVSWQLGIQDQINANLLAYAVTRRAFKSGGYNGSVAPRIGLSDTAGDGYLEERVTDVEIGTKFRGDIGAMPARVNVALFNNWIKNSQRAAFSLVLGNPASLTVNVPRGKTYGAELEAEIKPLEILTLGATYNYTHPRFSDDPVVVNGSSQIFDRVPDTPEMSGVLFADIDFAISAQLQATLHGDLYAQKVSYTAPRSQNGEGTVMPGYGLANFSITIAHAKGGWNVTALVKNAFNKVYFVGGLPTGEIYQINTLTPGDPRTYAVEARYKF